MHAPRPWHEASQSEDDAQDDTGGDPGPGVLHVDNAWLQAYNAMRTGEANPPLLTWVKGHAQNERAGRSAGGTDDVGKMTPVSGGCDE